LFEFKALEGFTNIEQHLCGFQFRFQGARPHLHNLKTEDFGEFRVQGEWPHRHNLKTEDFG
jgi:hypothetical protein